MAHPFICPNCGERSLASDRYEEEEVVGQPLTQALGLSFENGEDHIATVLEWGVRALGKPATLRTDSDLSANATADLFPAYDDDGGLLLVLTPTR